MKFSEKLKKAMQDLGLTQVQVVGMTGKSKGSISQYLSDKQVPTEQKQRDIAVSLGLDPDYFTLDQPAELKIAKTSGTIPKLLPEEAAKILGIDHSTVRKGLQQGVFPWGYGIKTSENRWAYFINAKRFMEIEGVTMNG